MVLNPEAIKVFVEVSSAPFFLNSYSAIAANSFSFNPGLIISETAIIVFDAISDAFFMS